jgi:hypothetical protein
MLPIAAHHARHAVEELTRSARTDTARGPRSRRARPDERRERRSTIAGWPAV